MRKFPSSHHPESLWTTTRNSLYCETDGSGFLWWDVLSSQAGLRPGPCGSIETLPPLPIQRTYFETTNCCREIFRHQTKVHCACGSSYFPSASHGQHESLGRAQHVVLIIPYLNPANLLTGTTYDTWKHSNNSFGHSWATVPGPHIRHHTTGNVTVTQTVFHYQWY